MVHFITLHQMSSRSIEKNASLYLGTRKAMVMEHHIIKKVQYCSSKLNIAQYQAIFGDNKKHKKDRIS